jgi:hypothetical protein
LSHHLIKVRLPVRLVVLILEERIGVLEHYLFGLLAILMLSDGLRLVPMDGAPDTYPLFVVKSPYVVHVALSHSDLPLSLDKRIFLAQVMLEVLRFALLLG